MDEEVARRFGSAVEAALRHELDSWAATGRGRLALVLLLDQMTRNLYRNDPRQSIRGPGDRRISRPVGVCTEACSAPAS
jgi:uncharacterized protein (DUF924 family)